MACESGIAVSRCLILETKQEQLKCLDKLELEQNAMIMWIFVFVTAVFLAIFILGQWWSTR